MTDLSLILLVISGLFLDLNQLDLVFRVMSIDRKLKESLSMNEEEGEEEQNGEA